MSREPGAAGETSRFEEGVLQDQPVHAIASLVRRGVNFSVAFVLTILAVPFFLSVGLLVFLAAGWPIFYTGIRLGRGRRPFVMFKFKTLVSGAEKRLGSDLATHRHDLMIPFGRMLRDSRLDELPQLINVLRGDMDIVGPRPERPVVYERVRHYRGYEKRFAVAPGLLGLSQMFTPHNTPKRLRVTMDNRLIRLKSTLAIDVLMTVFMPVLAVPMTFAKMGGHLYRRIRYGRRSKDNLREGSRVLVRHATIAYSTDDSPRHFCQDGTVALTDINVQAFHVRCSRPLPEPFPKYFRLTHEGVPVMLHRKSRRRRKSAVCRGRLIRMNRREDGLFDYAIGYEAVSQFNYYLIHQYFLRESFC